MRERDIASVGRDQISKLPYLTYAPADGRVVPVRTYYDHVHKRWLMWVVRDGKLQELPVSDLCHGVYIADEPVSPDRDHHLPFAETVMKHFCTPEIADRMNQASQDLINCLGYVEKYFILLHYVKAYGYTNGTALLQVELEGMFGLHRSYYDLLQRIVNAMLKRHSRHAVSLPDSFRRTAEKEPEVLQKKYHLPASLIQFYQDKKPLFFTCRQIRDNIFHQGHSLSNIFAFDDGFAIKVDDKPWTSLTSVVRLWPEDKVKKNGLGSALVVYSLLAEDMFKTMAWLGEAILGSFPTPPKACFDAHVYLRTPLVRHLHRLSEYEREQWITPEHALPEIGDRLQQPLPPFPGACERGNSGRDAP